ncbi:hypothetical protein FisN_24Lh077 [Fistulifera solaris]|uniref:5-hmdU DNA kinase helical domain-containing protein n=1 Tax=Fistulifera solaris TaxID=1519565 RepID=A0A1Z5K9C5_FISSO|nr:hypothetical protein FisN_24Lh077 [Fistulifera solaris]|eukprot:GAX22796.1 hypothetical protein FisN_24Lh077 [Fistulifera solaris]
MSTTKHPSDAPLPLVHVDEVLSRPIVDVKRKVPCPTFHFGQRIKKKFDGVYFYGTVEFVEGSYVSIIYDDGDEESAIQLDDDELLVMEMIDISLSKKIKYATEAQHIRCTNCLFSLQGLEQKNFQHKTSFIPGISSSHVSWHILEFYLFAYERQRMWERKMQHPENFPYSLNERMSRHSFCNIYRELDRGTIFLKASILELFYSSDDKQHDNPRCIPRPWSHKEWTKQVLWRSYMYRLVNRVETFENIGFAEPTDASLQAYSRRAQVYRDQAKSAFFTGAHNVSGFEPYMKALNLTLNNLDTIVDDFYAASTSKDKLDVLRGMKLVGDFYAWQILCDMETCGCLKIDYNFCVLGPGAKEGLKLVFRTSKNSLEVLKGVEKHLQLARILTALQENAFQILGLEFPYFGGKRLALKEIEHTLCEYSKYNISNGMHTYRPGEKSAIAVDCFSCYGKDPDHGYYCDLCNHFCCTGCLEIAGDANDYDERNFICPPCRQLESFFNLS